MRNERIRGIYNAAVQLFLRQGYSRTQISHIAEAAGVSVGTIYHDFAGKDDIMRFVLKCAVDPGFIDREFELPISGGLFDGLENEIIAAFEESAAAFSSNAENAADTYSFGDLISDAFDMLSRYAVGCLFIEKNQADCGILRDYYRIYRRRFFAAMTEYMNIFIEKGVVRPLKHVELSVTLIIEILTWWTMDMRYVSFDTEYISPEQAKEVCMDNIVTAYRL